MGKQAARKEGRRIGTDGGGGDGEEREAKTSEVGKGGRGRGEWRDGREESEMLTKTKGSSGSPTHTYCMREV